MKWKWFIVSGLLWMVPAQVAFARQPGTIPADTSRFGMLKLDEITVSAYEGNQKLLDVPAAVSVIPSLKLSSIQPASVVGVLNTLPGVRMEERSPGSYRISIRGSSLRSPFGVRNVKVYWNGIPVTQPSGSTSFNLLDQTNMDRIELMKGPSGSVYGAGNGGVLLLNSVSSNMARFVDVETSVGSFGLERYALRAGEKISSSFVQANVSRQVSDGYRRQSAFERTAIELSTVMQLSTLHQFSVHGLFSDLNYETPGGLTLAQILEDRRQARPSTPFVPGSEEANAGVSEEAFWVGASHRWAIFSNSTLQSIAYGQFSDFQNPFNLDFKTDTRSTGGFRSVFSTGLNLNQVSAVIKAGIEFQTARNTAKNFETDEGNPGALNFDDVLDTRQTLLFLQSEVLFGKGWSLTAGLGINSHHYSINRRIDNLNNDTGKVIRDFETVFSPRVAILKQLNASVSLHASLSTGFSPPTIEEVRTNEGSINLSLAPEDGVNIEIGGRGILWDNRLQFDITGFYFRLSDTIVQQQTDRGTPIFVNAGHTEQFGVEVAASVAAIKSPVFVFRSADWSISYTHHDFTFGKFQQNDQNFSGNDLTGVAPNVLAQQFFTRFSGGFFGSINWNFTDSIPLDDANTTFADSYHLLQVKTGVQLAPSNSGSLEFFFGVDNLLNERYSLGNDINAFGGRFFQPAPGRNYFGGMRVVFR